MEYDGLQRECPPTGIKGDATRDITGDPDYTPRPNPGEVKLIHLTNDGLFLDRCELTDVLYELTGKQLVICQSGRMQNEICLAWPFSTFMGEVKAMSCRNPAVAAVTSRGRLRLTRPVGNEPI